MGMKKFAYVILVGLAVVGMTGCTKGDKVKNTTLYVEQNGKVTSAIVEALDKDYFSIKELEKWIDEEVNTYNKENKGSIKVRKCEEESGKARVTLEFPSLEDYSTFNNVEAFFGTIEEAEKAGYSFNSEYISAKGKPSVTGAELEGSKSYYVLIVEEAQTIELDEDILYASSNVKVKGERASVDADTKELAYIIYKP